MTPPLRPPVFVPRASYRQRRVRDMARLLPLVGAVLFLIPLIWPQRGGTVADVQMTSGAIVYVFGVWIVLIVLAALIGRWLRPDDAAPDAATDRDGNAR